MVVLELSPIEKSIVDDIDEVGHGILYDLYHWDKPEPKEQVEVHEATAHLIQELRRAGKLEQVVIAGGLPTYAEVETETENGRRCRKRLKLN